MNAWIMFLFGAFCCWAAMSLKYRGLSHDERLLRKIGVLRRDR